MRRRFDQHGLLALAPPAFMGMFLEPPAERVVTIIGDVGVVDVQGPLVHHAGGWSDSYEEIVDRVSAALAETQVRTVVLRIDSPGGDVHGCFDAARTLRERARAAGKPLISWITGNGCSGAYALACAGSSIQVSDTACVGSIGILCTRLDETGADAQLGMGYTLVASGRRKTDQHSHTTPSVAELAAMQAQCEALASVFFDVVSAMRPGLSADAVRALEAGTFIGSEAVRLGLADGVAADLSAAVAAASGGTIMADEDEQTAAAPSSSQADIDDARAALQRAAADGDERARHALAVLDAEDEGDDGDEDEDGDEESAEADEDEDSASASGAAPAARAGGGVRAGATVPAAVAGTLASRLEALSAQVTELQAERAATRLTALLASRPDLTPELRQTLSGFTEEQARAVLAGMPKPPARRTAASAAAGTQVTGAAPAAAGRRPGSGDPELARAFGLSAQAQTVEHSQLTTTFRVPQQRGRRFGTSVQQQPKQTAEPASQPSNGRG